MNWDTKNSLLKDSFKHVLEISKPLNVKVELNEDEIMFDGWVSMRPDTIEVEVKSLKGCSTRTVDGWVVEESHIIPSTHWEPQDCDVVEVAQIENVFSTISYCLNKVRENVVARCVESYTESILITY